MEDNKKNKGTFLSQTLEVGERICLLTEIQPFLNICHSKSENSTVLAASYFEITTNTEFKENNNNYPCGPKSELFMSFSEMVLVMAMVNASIADKF